MSGGNNRDTIPVALAWLVYLGTALVQTFAIFGFLKNYWGWPGFISAVAAFIIASLPLAGGLCATISAVHVWGWAWWKAAFLFFWPWPLFVFFGFYDNLIIFYYNLRNLILTRRL